MALSPGWPRRHARCPSPAPAAAAARRAPAARWSCSRSPSWPPLGVCLFARAFPPPAFPSSNRSGRGLCLFLLEERNGKGGHLGHDLRLLLLLLGRDVVLRQRLRRLLRVVQPLREALHLLLEFLPVPRVLLLLPNRRRPVGVSGGGKQGAMGGARGSGGKPGSWASTSHEAPPKPCILHSKKTVGSLRVW